MRDYRNILIIILAIALIVSVSVLATRKPQIEVQYIPYEVIVEHVIQTETIAVPEEALVQLIENALGNNMEQVLQHIEDLNMKVSALTQINARGTGSAITTTIIEDGEVTPIDQELSMTFSGEPDISVPMARAILTREGQLDFNLYDLELNLDTIITEGSEGAISSISQLTLFSNGNPYMVPIEGTTYYNLQAVAENTERAFKIWDPRIDLSIDVGLWSDPYRFRPGASLGFSISSIRRGDSLAWRFLRLGMGFSTDKSPYFNLTPFTYNLGRGLPVFNDIWIGPGIGINTSGSWLLTFGIGTTL